VARLEDHPLPRLVRGGVHCTLSTDSRTVAQTTLSDEYRLAHEVMGMTLDELRRCNRTAYEAAFAPHLDPPPQGGRKAPQCRARLASPSSAAGSEQPVAEVARPEG